ncbi:MAG: hypothetical protein CVU08_06215 [Bacteroidetes bacterium HGW-Bacteroidetes-3]|jgi:hypothetical protein|nr:MAG: hypothetical protein CVU08_06215 [Bacteroidetes bacterium HGW-Bacteroidetes-3]
MNKLLKIESFQMNIAKTGVFSETYIYIVSYITLLIEISSIITLVFFKNKGLIFSFFMFLLFTFYIIYLRLFDKYEVCGCGGILNGLSFGIHLAINIGLIAITYYLIDKKNKKYEN